MHRNYANLYTLDGQMENIIRLIQDFGRSICVKQLASSEVTYFVGAYPLNALELAEVFARLMKRGLFEEEIATRTGFFGVKQVRNILELRTVSQEIKDLIYTGWVSWSLAVRIVRNQHIR